MKPTEFASRQRVAMMEQKQLIIYAVHDSKLHNFCTKKSPLNIATTPIRQYETDWVEGEGRERRVGKTKKFRLKIT